MATEELLNVVMLPRISISATVAMPRADAHVSRTGAIPSSASSANQIARKWQAAKVTMTCGGNISAI